MRSADLQTYSKRCADGPRWIPERDVGTPQGKPHLFELLVASESAEIDPVPDRQRSFIAPVPKPCKPRCQFIPVSVDRFVPSSRVRLARRRKFKSHAEPCRLAKNG